ncbi:hypothetical protein E7Y32_08825 [Arthrobacter sp. UKPF54-2]|uniref:hypothetical protein n=1 Tax=Arthrobacter sp. UKPF54-2 TaxID=2600159 RepID=UPI0011B1699C|nr:hypothetical protein [Arthrobacter sp. UKPF54-2]QDY90302.1 hypothetical protein E7Y32_08825 [Arthrobacter sp. UKPF54-2]
MSALWGARILRAKVFLLVLLLPLAACEYSPDEPVGPTPTATHSVDPGVFLAEVTRQLGGPPAVAGFPYASGTPAEWTVQLAAGDYLLTAACSGAARLEVKLLPEQALPQAWDYPCGETRASFFRHTGGKLTARATALGGLGTGVAGVKIEPNSDESLRENFGASAWARDVLDPSKPGEYRGSATADAPTNFGLLAPPGRYELNFACRGTPVTQLSIRSWNGAGVLAEVSVPCGEVISTRVQLTSEGAELSMAPSGGTGQYSFRLVPLGNGEG